MNIYTHQRQTMSCPNAIQSNPVQDQYITEYTKSREYHRLNHLPSTLERTQAQPKQSLLIPPLQHLHPPLPQPHIRHPADPIRRHDLAHARKAARHVVATDPQRALAPPQPRILPVVQVQPQQVHRGAGELHQRGTRELGHGGLGARRGGQRVGDPGAHERGDVEGGEDGDAVAEAEEGVGDFGDLFDRWVAC